MAATLGTALWNENPETSPSWNPHTRFPLLKLADIIQSTQDARSGQLLSAEITANISHVEFFMINFVTKIGPKRDVEREKRQSQCYL